MAIWWVSNNQYLFRILLKYFPKNNIYIFKYFPTKNVAWHWYSGQGARGWVASVEEGVLAWPGLDDDTEKQFLGIFHDFSWSPPTLRWAGTMGLASYWDHRNTKHIRRWLVTVTSWGSDIQCGSGWISRINSCFNCYLVVWYPINHIQTLTWQFKQ